MTESASRRSSVRLQFRAGSTEENPIICVSDEELCFVTANSSQSRRPEAKRGRSTQRSERKKQFRSSQQEAPEERRKRAAELKRRVSSNMIDVLTSESPVRLPIRTPAPAADLGRLPSSPAAADGSADESEVQMRSSLYSDAMELLQIGSERSATKQQLREARKRAQDKKAFHQAEVALLKRKIAELDELLLASRT